MVSRLGAVVLSVHYILIVPAATVHGLLATKFGSGIQLLPRESLLARLELATGAHVNPLPPERAALQLRLGKVF